MIPLLGLSLLPGAADGQEPLADALRSKVKSEAISFGALFQFVTDFQSARTMPGENGFSLANMRFNVGGRIDGGFAYFFQTNFGSILDARMSIDLGSALTLDLGKQKAPFSAEFLTGAESIDMVNRSLAVSALVPGRRLGAQIRRESGDSPFGFRAGVFNAGGDVFGNAEGEFAFVARGAWAAGSDPDQPVRLGLSVMTNTDPRPRAVDGSTAFANLEWLAGFDVRAERGLWLFSGEGLIGAGTPSAGDPMGGHLTLGYRPTTRTQLLVRAETLDPGVGGRQTLLIPGWNFWPTSLTEIQANLVLPTAGFDNEPQLLVNAQVAF